MGLTNADVPAEYGGSEMDKTSSAIIADYMAKYGSFMVSMGAHSGIGTLPLVFFGTEAQKKKYLPRLATGEIIGAYALSESTSGSDAMNSRTRAVLSPDGKHYLLNGEKMWITNAHFADLFTIFAKIDGEKFTAFLVEKDFPGFSVGAEEKKMGIRGSSTAPLILNECQGAGGERARRDRQGPHHRVQHPERRPLQAGRQLRRRGAHFAADTPSPTPKSAKPSARASPTSA